MRSMLIRSFQSDDEAAVIDLWQACGLVVPQNDPHLDIVRKLASQPELFLIGEEEGVIIGSCMAGYEGHRGWINYLAVAPAARRRGRARGLMEEAERRLRALGCPKINLQVRSTNAEVVAFYLSLGFKEDPVISLGKRL